MARERYLLHAGEEEINRPGAEKKADTKKAKWENFWYYHKLHVVIAVFVILLAGLLIHDIATKVEPDYQIALITQQSYPQEMTDALQNEIAKYGKDLNSDGKVIVQLSNYVIADDTSSGNVDMNLQAAGYTRLSADLSTGGSMIFITDDASFKKQQNTTQMFAYLNGSTPKDGAVDFENMRIGLKDCKKLTNSTNGMEGLSLSIRVYQDTKSQEKNDKETYYAASKKLFDQLVAK